MNARTEANLNQMASDVHLVTTPFRWIVQLLQTALFLVVFIVAVPLIFAGLVLHFILTGQTLLDADSVLVLKVVITFVMPFAVSIVYRVIQWNNKRDYVVGNHQVFFTGLGLIAAGALVAYPAWDAMKTELGLMALVMYQGSPLLLLFAKKERTPQAPAGPIRIVREVGIRPDGSVAVW